MRRGNLKNDVVAVKTLAQTYKIEEKKRKKTSYQTGPVVYIFIFLLLAYMVIHAIVLILTRMPPPGKNVKLSSLK